MSQSLTIQQLSQFAGTIMPKDSKVWLYGSRARGDNGANSDWDLLILLNHSTISGDDFDNYAYPFIEYGCMHDADVSPQIYSYNEWSNLGKLQTPYYQNVIEDKKVVYGND